MLLTMDKYVWLDLLLKKLHNIKEISDTDGVVA